MTDLNKVLISIARAQGGYMKDPIEIERDIWERQEAAQVAWEERILQSDLQPYSLADYLTDLSNDQIQALCDIYNGQVSTEMVYGVVYLPDLIKSQLGNLLIKFIDEKRLDDPDNEDF